jgi:hypothetical protein
MLAQTDLNKKRKDKYTLSILRVVKILVPIDPTLPIIRAALGTILYEKKKTLGTQRYWDIVLT